MEAIDVVVNSFTALKNHPKYVLPVLIFLIASVLIAAAILVPPLIPLASAINASGASAVPNPAVMAAVAQLIPNFIILTLIMIAIGIFLVGMYAHLALNYKNKESSLYDAFTVALHRYPSLLAYTVIILVIWAVIGLILYSPVIAAGASFKASTLQLSTILFLIAAIIMGPVLFTGEQVIVLENKGPIEALKSSVKIGLNDFIGIIVVTVISVIVFFVLYIVISLISILTFIGFLIFLVLLLFLVTFAFLIKPMYYITFARPTPQMAQTPTKQSQRPRRRRRK